MESETPGQTTENAGTVTQPPAATETSQPPQDQQTPPQQDSPKEGEQPAAPATERDAKGRFISNEERAKAGEAGGWMVHLRPEDREELKREPWRYSEMKAKLAAYEAANARTQPPAPVEPSQPDAAEEYARSMTDLNARSEKMTPEQFYREQAQIQREMARRVALEESQRVADSTYKQRTEAEQIAYINRQTETQNPMFKRLMIGIHAEAGGRLTPMQAFEMAKSEWAQFTQPQNGHATPPKPALPPPSLGEMRSVAQPQNQPSGDIYEKFARTAAGKALNERSKRP